MGPSAIYEHFKTTAHLITVDNFSIVGREDQNPTRATKALSYRVTGPSLNMNIGEYHLPHIWNEILSNTPEPF